MLRETLLAAALIVSPTGIAAAQTPSPASAPVPSGALTLPTVNVIAVTPLPGIGIDPDRVPANVQTLGPVDLRREGTPSLIRGLADQAGSVNINGTLGDPLQPDILYRGFEASPVLGTPQGIAVYQNGVRINEAFGDTVNWDLIPAIAIDRFEMVSANPIYGLNALGGAAVVTMKNGFTYQGFESEFAGGSFGQRGFAFQYGKQVDNWASYVAGRWFDEDGWRQFSPDHLRQIYADLAARGDKGTLDISFSGADNGLNGEGTTPIQSLAVNRTLDFTTPQGNANQLAFVTLNGSYQATDALSFQLNGYRRQFHQTVANGNTTDYTACAAGNELLCQPDGATPLVTASGGTIPDLSNDGMIPLGENDTEDIHTTTIGGALQATYTGRVLGHDNHLVIGASIDHSTVDFASAAEIGAINPALQVQSSGFFVNTPENSGFLATPVDLGATDDYYGAFFTDTFNATPALAVTAGGRFNLAEIALSDRLGPNLTGSSRYSRFNPAIGATYKLDERITAYAGYSEGNRVPTPSEIECSNPAQPCLLPSSLSSDPPNLKQVVSHTYEAGLRGRFGLPSLAPGNFAWNAGLFRTDLTDDIYGVATSVSSGYFANIGSTRRQGIETGLSYKDDSWSAFVNYSVVDAIFRSPLTLPSPSNPFADAAGDIHVTPGDRLPGIPLHQLKAGVDYRVTDNATVGLAMTYFSNEYLRGDESNRNAPLPGYVVLNLHGTYKAGDHIELFADISNLLDSKYATLGAYGDATGVGAPGVPASGGGVDNRFVAPGIPRAIYGGVRIRF
ncbi:MAG TPA: TonB-dependent receptor [Stellaceae bacterium]|nr:TonB-dependent receptor [Stellaceae bacterium]